MSASAVPHDERNWDMTRRRKPLRILDAEMMSDAEWELQRLYTAFGATMLAASNLENRLIVALLFADFLVAIANKAERCGGMTSVQYRSELHSYRSELFGRTLGQVIKRIEKLAIFDDELRGRIVAANKARNFLVHHFWRVRIPTMNSAVGLRTAQDELHELGEAFSKLDADIKVVINPLTERFSVSAEDIRWATDELSAELSGED
jgi:hypothetical protein